MSGWIKKNSLCKLTVDARLQNTGTKETGDCQGLEHGGELLVTLEKNTLKAVVSKANK